MLRTLSHVSLILIFGVSNPTNAQARPYGLGCKGPSNGPPDLSANGVPLTGSSVSLRLNTAIANAPCLLLIGASNNSWGGLRLPFDLSTIGQPGCNLEVSLDMLIPLTADTQGQVNLSLTMPPNPGLRGYLQGAVFAQSSTSTLGTSNGLEITSVGAHSPLSVMALPDTQEYVSNSTLVATFHAQTTWVAANRISKNIRFLSHVGDMTNNGGTGPTQNQTEWDHADAAMARLDGDLQTNPNGLIPYGVAIGNHDLDVINTKPGATQWIKYFGPTRYLGRSWFGGASKDSQNLYQIFDDGGLRFLHIVLEWHPSDDAISWAQDVITANPSLPVIITTHQYLGYGTTPGLDQQGGTPNSGGDNDGYGIRHKLVEPFPQVFMVLCGHYSGGSHRESTTILDQHVIEVLSNFQFDPNGGNGWMNRIEFRPDQSEMQSVCISPVYIPGTTTGTNHSTTANNNFTKPFDFHLHRRRLSATTTLHFTNDRDHGRGAGNYGGTVDTYIATSSSTTSHASSTDLRVDTNSASSADQSLLRFDSIFGNGIGQIPANQRIEQAILTLTTEGSGATSTTGGRFYRLTVPFNDTSTWQGLGNGIQIGSETVATADADTGNQVDRYGTSSFDVTASLRAWQKGSPNHGWAIINPGSRRWSFRSSEWGTTTERPMLTVVLEN